jgi:hypothetical protein
MRGRSQLAVVIAAVAAVAGCNDKPGVPGGRDAVISAWTKAGVTMLAMTPADGAAFGAGNCLAGTAQGLDVTLCSYPDPAAATGAQPAGLAAVGAATGVSLAEGSLLLVIADRRNADPSGRAIHQLTQIFRGRT